MNHFKIGRSKFYDQTWQNRLLQYSAFGLILFGIKLWLIQHFGNATPFWDQWDAEAINLYEPYLNGKLTLKDLLAPHNEHRILTTRLLALALLQINNSWNPLLQMVVNAGLHIILITVTVHQLLSVTGRNYLPAILFFSFILFAIPFGWENSLAGFQSQFYLALLFGVLTIRNLVLANPLSAKWWLGIVWATLAFFSLGSGIFAVGAATGICFIRFFTAQQRTPRQLIAIAITATFFIAGIKLTPTIPDHAVYKASSIEQFYYSLITVFAWPLKKSLVTAFLCNIPTLVFLIQLVRKRPQENDRNWYLAGLTVWSFAQLLSISYGRATINLSSRYFDIYSINILVNFVCLLMVIKLTTASKQVWVTRAAIGWTALLVFAMVIYAGRHTANDLYSKHANSILQETNTRNYLSTGDIGQLKNKGQIIPYPNADHLAFVLSRPVIRRILPANINKLKPAYLNNPEGAFIPNGYSPNTQYRSDTTLGSYHKNENGSEAKGTVSLLFNNDQACNIQFDVTGYPTYDSMSIAIEQNNQRKAIKIKDNPELSWVTVYTKVDKGPFSLILIDSNSTAEMAISMPAVAGNIDNLINKTLSFYYVLIALGVTILAILILKGVLVGTFANFDPKE